MTPGDPLSCHSASGLGGELRPVNQAERRIIEAAKLGFTTVIMSSVNQPPASGRMSGVNIIGCQDIREALQAALGVSVRGKEELLEAEEQFLA